MAVVVFVLEQYGAYTECMHCNLHCVVVCGGGGLFSRAMVHIVNVCIHLHCNLHRVVVVFRL